MCLEVKKIHACKNNYILYRGAEYKDLEKWFICGLNYFNHRKDDGDDVKYNRRKDRSKRSYGTFLLFLIWRAIL
jgi:hypothetical protein